MSDEDQDRIVIAPSLWKVMSEASCVDKASTNAPVVEAAEIYARIIIFLFPAEGTTLLRQPVLSNFFTRLDQRFTLDMLREFERIALSEPILIGNVNSAVGLDAIAGEGQSAKSVERVLLSEVFSRDTLHGAAKTEAPKAINTSRTAGVTSTNGGLSSLLSAREETFNAYDSERSSALISLIKSTAALAGAFTQLNAAGKWNGHG